MDCAGTGTHGGRLPGSSGQGILLLMEQTIRFVTASDGVKLDPMEKYGIKAPVKISDTCPRVQPGESEGTITLTKEELVYIIQAALERLKHHND